MDPGLWRDSLPAQLQGWRGEHPVRGLCSAEAALGPLPPKRQQRQWTRYTQETPGGGVRQQHLVQLLVRSAPTGLPRGVSEIRCPESASLLRAERAGVWMEMYTNIHRVDALARTHPLVGAVALNKVSKALAHNGKDDLAGPRGTTKARGT